MPPDPSLVRVFAFVRSVPWQPPVVVFGDAACKFPSDVQQFLKDTGSMHTGHTVDCVQQGCIKAGVDQWDGSGANIVFTNMWAQTCFSAESPKFSRAGIVGCCRVCFVAHEKQEAEVSDFKREAHPSEIAGDASEEVWTCEPSIMGEIISVYDRQGNVAMTIGGLISAVVFVCTG